MDNWRITHLLELHQNEPKDEFVIFALGQEYSKQGNLHKALEYYQSLKEQNADYVGLYYHLAALYKDLERIDEAFETFEQGISVARRLQDQHALSELMNAKSNLEIEM